ncbi:hypothetical protein HPB48_004551 [Haemaphysalis longicornis]|uniref:Uncharacterized protein n=1 Tax=Haemaphysalis longicornis TaxID=44386 RepID=A0A9J6H5N3_HAELO|nr:hypothetical protein HPB48_004551 [Haemaphysalis longicornis]
MALFFPRRRELKATSGQWMQDLCRRSSRRRKLNGPPVTDLLGRALQCAPSSRAENAASRSSDQHTTSAASTSPRSARALGNSRSSNSASKTPPMNRPAAKASPDAIRPPAHTSTRPDSPQSLAAQDSLSSDVSSAAESSNTTLPASSASKPTSEGTPPPSSAACPSPPTGVRWAPLRGPLRTPIRKLPRQGSSLSSSSDSTSVDGSRPAIQQPPSVAADESPPPVPYPRTKRQSPQRQSPQRQLPPSPQDSPSPPTQKQQLLKPEPKQPLAPSLSAPASPAFRARARSALTVTYSSPPSVQDSGRGQTLPARKATAPELTGLERAKEVAFRRVTLGSVRMESTTTVVVVVRRVKVWVLSRPPFPPHPVRRMRRAPTFVFVGLRAAPCRA